MFNRHEVEQIAIESLHFQVNCSFEAVPVSRSGATPRRDKPVILFSVAVAVVTFAGLFSKQAMKRTIQKNTERALQVSDVFVVVFWCASESTQS